MLLTPAHRQLLECSPLLLTPTRRRCWCDGSWQHDWHYCFRGDLAADGNCCFRGELLLPMGTVAADGNCCPGEHAFTILQAIFYFGCCYKYLIFFIFIAAALSFSSGSVIQLNCGVSAHNPACGLPFPWALKALKSPLTVALAVVCVVTSSYSRKPTVSLIHHSTHCSRSLLS